MGKSKKGSILFFFDTVIIVIQFEIFTEYYKFVAVGIRRYF